MSASEKTRIITALASPSPRSYLARPPIGEAAPIGVVLRILIRAWREVADTESGRDWRVRGG